MRFLVSLVILASTIAAGAQEQVLVLQRLWASTPSLEYNDCIEVKSDGSYQFEHTSLNLGQEDRRQVHVGRFSDDEMKQLSAIVNGPALRSLSTPKPGPGFMTWGPDFDLLWVVIGRGDNFQSLAFDSSGGGNHKYAGTRLPTLHQTPAMKPLFDWYKQASKRKDDIDKNALPTCSLRIKQAFSLRP